MLSCTVHDRLRGLRRSKNLVEKLAVKLPDMSKYFMWKIHVVLHEPGLHVTIGVQIHLRFE